MENIVILRIFRFISKLFIILVIQNSEISILRNTQTYPEKLEQNQVLIFQLTEVCVSDGTAEH